MKMTRRDFVGAAAMAVGGMAFGAKKDDFIWAALLHMGYNMWSDRPCVGREIPQDEKERAIWDANQADWLRFD